MVELLGVLSNAKGPSFLRVSFFRCDVIETDKFDSRLVVAMARIYSFEFEGSLDKVRRKMNGPSCRATFLNEASQSL